MACHLSVLAEPIGISNLEEEPFNSVLTMGKFMFDRKNK